MELRAEGKRGKRLMGVFSSVKFEVGRSARFGLARSLTKLRCGSSRFSLSLPPAQLLELRLPSLSFSLSSLFLSTPPLPPPSFASSRLLVAELDTHRCSSLRSIDLCIRSSFLSGSTTPPFRETRRARSLSLTETLTGLSRSDKLGFESLGQSKFSGLPLARFFL